MSISKQEMEKQARLLLDAHGYRKIKIYPRFFSQKLDVYAKDEHGVKRQLVCFSVHKKGHTFLTLKEVDNSNWIYRIEEWDALMND